ncbi:MAG: penicillin-binding transpeptidase domain-containing protein [Pseudomonadota bacterium]
MKLFTPAIEQRDLDCSTVELHRISGVQVAHVPTDKDCSDSHYKTVNVTAENHDLRLPATEAVEGAVGSILTYNPIGIARAAKNLFQIGGSGPDQSAFEYVATDGERMTRWQKIGWLTLHGPVIAAHYAQTKEEREVFAHNHLPCLRGIEGFGPTVQRLSGGYCNLLVGKRPGDPVTTVEACVIAVSHWRQFAVPGADADTEALATMDAQFTGMKQRADKRCLQKLWTGADLDRARAELAELARPELDFILKNGRPQVHPFPAARTWIATMRVMDGEIRLDRAAQSAMEEVVANDRDTVLAPRLADGLCVEFGGTCDDQDQIDMFLMLAEPMADGRLEPRAVLQNRPGLLTHTGHEGQRSFASTIKPLLVPIIIEDLHRGDYRVDLCKQAAKGLRDADGNEGGACSDSANWLNLEAALAESSNLAFNYALSHIDEDRLRDYLIHLGFHVPGDLTGFTLRRALLMGDRVTISADALMRAYATVALDRPMQSPMMLDRAAQAPLDLSGFASAAARTRAAAVLGAPVTHSEGTARSVAALARQHGCTVPSGKTGTADAEGQPLARDRVFEAMVQCDGRQMLVLALVGAPAVDRILGPEVRSRHINEMAIKAAIKALKS